ncbi:MAG: carbonic anhydrase [Armatimonadetes bacterium]|nr:carbonic anhydrase [Armatimonadota bacterium]
MFKPALAAIVLLLFALPSSADQDTYVRTREQRDAMTPQQVVQSLKAGNQRFLEGKAGRRNFLAEQRATASGQHPSAVVLSCIDSRAPAEILFDKGIGEIFNARIAGNVANPDLVGSMEFACAVAGAKVVLVLGHTGCGAVNGAIDHVELGNLTGLLERIYPAVQAASARLSGPYSSDNSDFVRAVTRQNVELTIAKIRRISPLLREMEEKGTIAIQGAIYNLDTGRIEFLEDTTTTGG